MRKGLSILSILVILLSGAHVTIARHFCGGMVAGTKVSLTGQLAGCGMEDISDSCPVHGPDIKASCCENQVSTIGIISNFIPPAADVSSDNLRPHTISGILIYPKHLEFQDTYKSYTDSGPPGQYLASFAGLDKICVFRI